MIESRQSAILLTCSDTATFPSVWFYLAIGGALAVLLTAFGFVDLHNIGKVISDYEVKVAQKDAKDAATKAEAAAAEATNSSNRAHNAATQAEGSAKKAANDAVATALKTVNADMSAAKARAEQAAKQTEQTATKADAYFDQITNDKIGERLRNKDGDVGVPSHHDEKTVDFPFQVTHAWLELTSMVDADSFRTDVSIEGKEQKTVRVNLFVLPKKGFGQALVNYKVWAIGF